MHRASTVRTVARIWDPFWASPHPARTPPIDECRHRVGTVERRVKHAGAAALQGLSDLLEQIRIKQGLKEKKLGIFYRKSKSFLHFHEDPAGLFADLSVGTDFDRYPVNTKKQWKTLLTAIDRALGD
jgi:hypothetical protein